MERVCRLLVLRIHSELRSTGPEVDVDLIVVHNKVDDFSVDGSELATYQHGGLSDRDNFASYVNSGVLKEELSKLNGPRSI